MRLYADFMLAESKVVEGRCNLCLLLARKLKYLDKKKPPTVVLLLYLVKRDNRQLFLIRVVAVNAVISE